MFMQRKLACYITAAATVLFMVLRVVVAVNPSVKFSNLPVEDLMIGIALTAMVAVAILSVSKTPPRITPAVHYSSLIGWIATFGGAMLIMSTVLDIFCWSVYNQTPPPNERILNNVDFYCLICSLVFGLLSGLYFVLQGFRWMAGTNSKKNWLLWLSVTPILWMWFRLARYEISYASTIDISHSFFDFAVLVTASLFFLHLTKAVSELGNYPANTLIVFSLFSTIACLSGAPLAVYRLLNGAGISTLLIGIVDISIGMMSFLVALEQAFAKPEKPSLETTAEEECASIPDTKPESDEEALAWTTPAKKRPPLDPPFSIDEKLPPLDDEASKATHSPCRQETTLTVDDILAELNMDE